MYAIVEIGGSQWKVEKNDEILVDLIQDKKGAKLIFETVTLLRDDKSIEIGQPYVKKAVVEAKLVEPIVPGKKIDVFKYKSKTNYRVKTGHRQKYSMLQITNIGKAAAKVAATEESAEKPATKKKESAE